MFDAEQFLKDYNIPYWTEGPNCQDGWINIQCPVCDDPSNHGGFNLVKEYYNCWKCQWTSMEDVVKTLIAVDFRTAKDLIREYKTTSQKPVREKKVARGEGALELPGGSGPLKTIHKKYLKKRGFDYREVEKTWGLRGTTTFGNYKYRIIAPIYVNRKLVSYQGRDITDRSGLRYKACKIEEEIIHHKHIVYGSDLVLYRKGIVVEGITDAWKIGAGAVATFGTGYTMKQIEFIASVMDTAFILYDREEEEKAQILAMTLGSLGVGVERIQLTQDDDPGQMSNEDAAYMRKELLNY